MFGFLGCEGTYVAQVQLPVHSPVPPGPFWQGCTQSFLPQLVLVLEIALTQVQNLAHGFVKDHEILLDPLLKPVLVHLDGILSLLLTMLLPLMNTFR